ncbi:hypothetical protein Sjap_010456 [Stephania japonica]|uniref:Inositol polyphosphate-related phosphatase domain-containing protein n=1 Tax=Stephania japonica TaxID=461633 RepID=A0AAP0P4L5_9MAGN
MGGFSIGCCCRRRKSKSWRSRDGRSKDHIMAHDGIKTVEVEKLLEGSSGSALRICIVTWNMNGQVSYRDLAEIVGNDRKFDLLVVGLQEVPRVNVAQLLQEALVETHSLMGESVMQSLQLYVFGPKNYELFLEEFRVDKYAVGGFGGLIRRKKGAVAVRIGFKGVHMLFICCHLSAHACNVEERNSELRHISRSLFSKNHNPYSRPSQITVWLGDLNYRIEGLDTLPAKDLIHHDLHGMLTSKDQLLQEAERGQIFSGFSEGNLEFKPTYKYDVGTSIYDTSHKVRMPSWTDRILFKIERHGDIDAMLHSYESIDKIHSSDHKPVKALLSLKPN